jgi:transitional endoplasmic reticulum ATPase
MANGRNKTVEVEHNGTSKMIIVPEGLSLDSAIEWLQRKKADEEKEVQIVHVFDAWPLDGARALMHVLREMYGYADSRGTPSFFGTKPPTLMEVEVEYGKYERVVWGAFALPGISGTLKVDGHVDKDGTIKFAFYGVVKQKHEKAVQAIADAVRLFLLEHSIYRGKAFRLKVEDGTINVEQPPRFLDLRGASDDSLILNDDLEYALRANLFALLEQTAECVKYGIPLKRGILMAGKYGTGKTLSAYVAARKAVEHGWTFIYLDDPAGLPKVMGLARMYSPTVIFAEDIDRVVGEVRDGFVDQVLNTVDGLDSKGHKIMVVLTTNHIEKINRAMLRPGRLDAVLSFTAPDAKTAQRLLRYYGRGLVPMDEDISAAADLLAGQIPAVLRETVERAKLFAISEKRKMVITGDVLLHAARHMMTQTDLLASLDRRPELPPSIEQIIEQAAYKPVAALEARLKYAWENSNIKGGAPLGDWPN